MVERNRPKAHGVQLQSKVKANRRISNNKYRISKG